MSSMKPEKIILPSKLLSCLIAFSFLVFISSSFSILEFNGDSLIPKPVRQFITVNDTPNAKPDAQQTPPFATPSPAAVNGITTSRDPDPGISTAEPGKHRNTPQSDKDQTRLRVYMYDLPPEFHFGLLGWKGSPNYQTWPDVSDPKGIPSYPGGLNLQHSIEYWLTLDILSSNSENVDRPCTAMRVMDSSQADIIFVPFFSSLSYNRHSKRLEKDRASGDQILQEKLVEFLSHRREWKRSGGRDHLFVAHHPNSMLYARRKLGSSMLVLSDFGRYMASVANLKKDVIAPYKHMVRTVAADNSASFEERPTLVYFQGAIYRKDGGVIRQELYYILKDEKDVHFTFGTAQSSGVREAGKGMSSSKFCLNIAGDTPSSNRLFDAIATQCVPVIISDEIELPFEDVLDYSQFSVFVRASDAVKKGYLLKLLRGITSEKWTEMWDKLKSITGHFEYQYPSQPDDAVDMIWQTIARKKASMGQLSVHRKNRYSRSPTRPQENQTCSSNICRVSICCESDPILDGLSIFATRPD